MTRERVCFHAAGLTSALEVNKPPSLRPADNLGAATLILHVFEGKLGAGEEPRTLEELGAQLWTLEGVWEYQEKWEKKIRRAKRMTNTRGSPE